MSKVSGSSDTSTNSSDLLRFFLGDFLGVSKVSGSSDTSTNSSDLDASASASSSASVATSSLSTTLLASILGWYQNVESGSGCVWISRITGSMPYPAKKGRSAVVTASRFAISSLVDCDGRPKGTDCTSPLDMTKYVLRMALSIEVTGSARLNLTGIGRRFCFTNVAPACLIVNCEMCLSIINKS